MQFLNEEEMIIKNTFYEFLRWRIYTWKSTQDRDKNPIRNQKDYNLISEKYRKPNTRSLGSFWPTYASNSKEHQTKEKFK